MNTNEIEFYKRLRSTFAVEAHDHMRNISLLIIELETAEDIQDRKTIIETIHREFHSLKGAARAVDISEIETICHMMESIFSDIKNGILNISSEMFDSFNKALDVIEEVLSLDIDESFNISELMKELKNIKDNDVTKKIDSILNNESIQNEESVSYEEPSVEITMETQSENKQETEEVKKIEAIESDIDEKIKIKALSQNTQTKALFNDNSMEHVRVAKNKLDSILLQGEEMLYAKLSIKQRENEIRDLKVFLEGWKQRVSYNDKSNLEYLSNKIDTLLSATMNDGQVVEIMLNRFIDDIKDLMLQPFSSIIEMFPKMVRDISRKLGKEIEFTYSGAEFEIDRRILDELKDPLMHIIRNSVDHGIEMPYERKKLNKNSHGTISLNISQIGSGHIQIEINDDGAGINGEKLKKKAVENNLLSKDALERLNEHDAQMLIFKSGITTKEIITDLSGRGLGLAIVREKIEKLDGSIYVTSQMNKGTTFRIVLPITISTNRGVIVKVSKQEFVLPTSRIEKVIKVNKDEINLIENKATIIVDDKIIPIVQLSDILKLKEDNEKKDDKWISLVIVNEFEKTIGFSVDEVIVEQEVLVKQFNKQLAKVRNISGATILGTGDVVPILEVQDLVKSSLNAANSTFGLGGIKEKDSPKSIIVVEDSITSRTLLKNVLENNGYKVKTAVDGVEGLKIIKSEKFDLIISDVEMPRMDGFQLTTEVRNDETISKIPVILVTSLDSQEDIERGIEVGASAYIVKSNFQQNNLLEVIKKLI